MDSLQTITSTYKRQFIEDIITGMEPFLDNPQLMELNKSLNYHTGNLIISEKPDNIDKDYNTTNTLLIKEFIKNKKLKGLSHKSLHYYESQLNRFKEWSIKSFLEMNANDLKEYMKFYQNYNDCSKTTLDNLRRILNTFYKYLEIEEKIIINPMRRIPHIKVPKKVRKAFTDTEVELLRTVVLKKPNPLRNSAILELLLSSGLRLSELSSLKINDIILADCKGVCMGKGNKERVFYFSERTKILLEKYLKSRIDNNPFLFVHGYAPYNKLGNGGIGIMIRELGRSIGIDNTHPHRFRRTMATRLVRKGMPIEQVSKLLGHESLSVTMRYIETDKELLKLVHKKHTN